MNTKLLGAMARCMRSDAAILSVPDPASCVQGERARVLAANLVSWADLLETVARDYDDGITIPQPPIPMVRSR